MRDSTDAEENDGIFLALSCASFCRVYADWEWLLHHREAVEQALQQLQERRILISMQQSSVGRIHDDLDRAFQRIAANCASKTGAATRATLVLVRSPLHSFYYFLNTFEQVLIPIQTGSLSVRYPWAL